MECFLLSTDEALPALSASATRMRRRRQRIRGHRLWLQIELRQEEVDVLVAVGVLAGERRGDTGAVAIALHKLLQRVVTPQSGTADEARPPRETAVPPHRRPYRLY